MQMCCDSTFISDLEITVCAPKCHISKLIYSKLRIWHSLFLAVFWIFLNILILSYPYKAIGILQRAFIINSMDKCKLNQYKGINR